LFVLPLSLLHMENRVCLSHGVYVVGVTWRVAMRIVVGVGDLVWRIGDGHIGRILGGRTNGRLGGAVCDLYRARRYEERGFLG
jgi:predicted metal-binding membrane protein